MIPQKGSGGSDDASSRPPASEPVHEEEVRDEGMAYLEPTREEPTAPFMPAPQPEPQAQQEPQFQPVQSAAPAPAEYASRDALRGTDAIFHIEVEKITPNPGQPRRNFDEAALRDLAHSIREFGFLQPLVVSKIEKETPTGVEVAYQLIAGERRLLAAKMLGLPLVPVIIRRVDLEREKVELAVIENIQRENLNPIETARAFQRLQEEFRMTQREIAAKLGKSREGVANTVRLLDLPEYVQTAVEKGEISESHARLLLSIADPGTQKLLFEDITQRHLSMRESRERVESLGGKRRGRPLKSETNLPPELKAMQESLSGDLGAPVEIYKGATKGSITITFYSEEELEGILRRLGSGD